MNNGSMELYWLDWRISEANLGVLIIHRYGVAMLKISPVVKTAVCTVLYNFTLLTFKYNNNKRR